MNRLARTEAALHASRSHGSPHLTPRARAAHAMSTLGSPQRRIPVIHVAGTNGKTSTVRLIDRLLCASGLRVGRFTSPHLETMRERIVLQGQPISTEQFVALHEHVASRCEGLGFFEMLTAMALCCFADAEVDVAVVEVGRGGVSDATNVVNSEVAVITAIGVDHVPALGSDPVQIAKVKAGIIKRGSDVVIGAQPDGLAEVIEDEARTAGAASVITVGQGVQVQHRAVAPGGQSFDLQTARTCYPNLTLPLIGRHQADNAAAAVAAAEAFMVHTSTGLSRYHVQRVIRQATAHGRLEVVSASPLRIMDVSHNPAGMLATRLALQESFPGQRFTAVVALGADKDAVGFLRALSPVVDTVIATENPAAHCLPAYRLAAIGREIVGSDRLVVEPDLGRALRLAADGSLLVTGSVLNAGPTRAALRAQTSAGLGASGTAP